MKFLKIAVSNTGNSNDGKLLVSWYYALNSRTKPIKLVLRHLFNIFGFKITPLHSICKVHLYQYNK